MSHSTLHAPWVDLSYPLHEGMPFFPSQAHGPFQAEITATIEAQGRETRRFAMGSHCGTHIDAMRHFVPNGKTIDQLSLDALIGPAQLVDLGRLAPGTIIAEADLAAQLSAATVDRIILRTGWDRYWGTPQFYRDWPVLSATCAQWLVDRRIRLLGFDVPSPDPLYDGTTCTADSPNHKLFFSREIILVEYLTRLDQLPAGPIFLIVHPLPLQGFDGAPARVCATPL